MLLHHLKLYQILLDTMELNTGIDQTIVPIFLEMTSKSRAEGFGDEVQEILMYMLCQLDTAMLIIRKHKK